MSVKPLATSERLLDRRSILPTRRMAVRAVTTPDYEYRLTQTPHLQRIAQIARKQTRGSSVDWQDALQAAQIKLIVAIRNTSSSGRCLSGANRFFLLELALTRIFRISHQI